MRACVRVSACARACVHACVCVECVLCVCLIKNWCFQIYQSLLKIMDIYLLPCKQRVLLSKIHCTLQKVTQCICPVWP